MIGWKLVVSLIAGGVAALAAEAQEFKVIVHPSVPLESVSARQLAPLFLKKTTTYASWGNPQKVVPFDLGGDSRARESFTKAVLDKSIAAVKAYWQQQIFSGRGLPPTELGSDRDMIAAVARTAGAIGYVSAQAALPGGVKQVRVTQ